MSHTIPLATALYIDQVTTWPTSGQQILAQYDESTIVVYQAYRPSTAYYAVKRGTFDKDFSYSRMSWIKPNFLWMMYRSGWGKKENQEITLALRLRREFFDSLLAAAVPSTWDLQRYHAEEDWKHAVGQSTVRLQWDPDHDPFGNPLERRAIQLGLRGETLRMFGKQELLEVIDLSEFVAEQRLNLETHGVAELVTPRESVYPGGLGHRNPTEDG